MSLGSGTALGMLASRRDGDRYAVSLSVDLLRGSERHGSAVLVDISRSGASFQSYSMLEVGGRYRLVLRGLGTYDCEIVRRIGAHSYGVRLLIGEISKLELGQKLDRAFASKVIA